MRPISGTVRPYDERGSKDPKCRLRQLEASKGSGDQPAAYSGTTCLNSSKKFWTRMRRSGRAL